MTQMSADVLILRQQEQQIQFFFLLHRLHRFSQIFYWTEIIMRSALPLSERSGERIIQKLYQKFFLCGWDERNWIEEGDSARGILRLTEVSIDKLFDLRSSSVATRHSSSKLGSALAAPSFIMTTFVRRWSMVRNTISSSTLFHSCHPSESAEICGICGQI